MLLLKILKKSAIKKNSLRCRSDEVLKTPSSDQQTTSGIVPEKRPGTRFVSGRWSYIVVPGSFRSISAAGAGTQGANASPRRDTITVTRSDDISADSPMPTPSRTGGSFWSEPTTTKTGSRYHQIYYATTSPIPDSSATMIHT
jgi:hypothetical protein